MKSNKRGFFAGFLTALVLVGLIGTAIAYQQQATLTYSGISITLDGSKITPKDVNGKIVEPFSISGTTYLPVRAVATALGMNVDWNQSTQTVVLTTKSNVATETTLVTGEYIVGKHVSPGEYDARAISGGGNFIVYSSTGRLKVNEILGVKESPLYTPQYKNLSLEVGDQIKVSSTLEVLLIPQK